MLKQGDGRESVIRVYGVGVVVSGGGCRPAKEALALALKLGCKLGCGCPAPSLDLGLYATFSSPGNPIRGLHYDNPFYT